MLPIVGIGIGASDPEATAGFLRLFGYSSNDGRRFARSSGARLDVTRVDAVGEVRRGFDRGPRGLDVYVHDIDRALALAASGGWSGGPIATIALGPVRMRQSLVAGPDGLPVVLVESSHRRPSLLDSEDHWCSEIYSVVWCVTDRDRESALWTSATLEIGRAHV